jgi:hypothetical protein
LKTLGRVAPVRSAAPLSCASAPAYATAPPAWWRLAEPAAEPLSEADLSLIWEGQRFPPEALQAVDGRAVTVINPGRRGGSSGPDFLDAVVLLDGRERRGDIELHVRASAFRGHGHATDPNYARLALHVVYRADDGPQTALWGGGSAPVAAFAPWLERRGAELSSWLAAPSMWQEPCRGVSDRLGAGFVRDTLAEAGRRRFEDRAALMRDQAGLLGAEEALWRGLLDTLGIGGDRAGFRRLAEVFPASLAGALPDPEAALLFVAGLGEAPTKVPTLPPPLRPALRATGRPANHPRRRLSGLAALYRRAANLAGDQDRALSQLAQRTVQEPQHRRAMALWQVPGKEGPALIGPERARELLINAVLPAAAALGRRRAALTLLGRLPAGSAYGRTNFLEANLRPAKGRIVRTALQQQGLLALIGRWCSRGGCGRCPLSAVEIRELGDREQRAAVKG